jgi:MFS family permease
VLLAVLVLTTAGLALTSVAPNLPVFLVGRSLAGVSGASFPLVFAVVRGVLPGERVASGIGLLSSALGIGSAIGWVLAGPLADHVGWWSLSALPLLLSALAIAGVALVVPRDPAAAAEREPVDWVGAVLLAVWLVLLLVGVSQGSVWGWASVPVLAMLVGGVVVAVGWSAYELRRRHPLVDLRMQRSTELLTANAAALVGGFALMAAGVLVPVLVQLPHAPGGVGLGGDATAAALSQLPAALAMIPAGPLAGRLTRPRSPRLPLVLGAGLVVVAYVFGAIAHSALWQLWVLNGVRGTGVGLVYAAMATLAVLAVPAHQTGAASGVNTLVRNLGVAIGSQVTATIHAAAGDTDASYAVAFLVPAVLCAIVLVVVLPQMLRDGRRGSSDAGSPAPARSGLRAA